MTTPVSGDVSLPFAFRDSDGDWLESHTANASNVPYYVNTTLRRKTWSHSKKEDSGVITFVERVTSHHRNHVINLNPSYDMAKDRRMIIIDNVCDATTRAERKLLRELFQYELRFGDYVPKDEKINSDEMMTFLQEEACADRSGDSCLVFLIFCKLKPKSSDLLHFGDGFDISMEDIMEPFHATKTLVGKPKMFFFRCIGDHLQTDGGVPGVSQEAKDGTIRSIRIPALADVVSVFCPTNGLDFVTHFCKEIESSQESRTILKIMTRANRKAFLSHLSSSTNTDPKVAVVRNTLTKSWYLP